MAAGRRKLTPEERCEAFVFTAQKNDAKHMAEIQKLKKYHSFYGNTVSLIGRINHDNPARHLYCDNNGTISKFVKAKDADAFDVYVYFDKNFKYKDTYRRK